MADISQAVGGKALATKVYELPLGESVCPVPLRVRGGVAARPERHRSSCEHRNGEEEFAEGELVWFLPGPAGAHKVTNRGDRAARVAMFSSAREPAVAVYPDSDKIGVWPGNSDDDVMLRRADGKVGYWDGER